jgi:tripartite-type tricarboxylate transporter receptor subunit TctC
MRRFDLRLIPNATLAAAFLAAASPAAPAQDYPSRPITVVVPLGAGTTADIVARLIAERMSKDFGQPVTVSLKPGLGGGVAMEEVAKAPPDGYTLAMITQGTHVFNVSLYKSLRYDPKAQFAPITSIAAVSNIMVVHPSNPAKSPLDVVAAAKNEPGKLTYASGGNGTSHHMSGALFASMNGIEITHVPHLVSLDGIRRIVDGELTMGFFNTPTVLTEIRTGKLKALAVTSKSRSPHLPDVPTLDESGVKGFDVVTWFGYAAPAGTPAAVIQRLRDEFAKAASDPAIKAKLTEAGLDPMDQLQPAEFAKLIDADLAKWTPIIKASGARVD